MEGNRIKKMDRARVICESYRNGMTVSELCRAFDCCHPTIVHYLEKYFEVFYGEGYKPFTEQKKDRLEYLYNGYKELYIRGLYSRNQICEMLGCSVNEFEAMCSRYGLKNQWLKTYAGQVTLCNVSKEFKDSIVKFAKKYGFKSCRAVAVRAINEFMLQQEIFGEKETDEDAGC